MASPNHDYARYSYVYHPSLDHKERWQKAARKAQQPLIMFIIETMDSYLDESEDYPFVKNNRSLFPNYTRDYKKMEAITYEPMHNISNARNL